MINIKFLENIKEEFKRTISWNKYRSKITTPNKKLDYSIDPNLEILTDCLYFHSKMMMMMILHAISRNQRF